MERKTTSDASDPVYHVPVLLREAVEGLSIKPDGVYVDCTLGGGGHGRAILERLGPKGRLIAFDQDADAVRNLPADSRVQFWPQNFRHLRRFLRLSDIDRVDGVLADLGVSSHQFDEGGRGFSIRFEGPLDMRMDTTRGMSVAQWLQDADIQTLTEVIRDYGEERFAGAIAKAIVARRTEHGPITRTTELATLVAAAVKTREKGQNPATRTFQAFRIFINAELEELTQGLSAALRLLKPGGRLVVVTFHSLEDRIVKQFLKQRSEQGQGISRHLPDAYAASHKARPSFEIMHKKPLQSGAQELQENIRARSAKLRAAIRLQAA